MLEEVGAIYGFSAVFENESLKDVRLLFRVPKYDDAAKVLSLIETVCKIRIHYSDGVVRVSEQ